MFIAPQGQQMAGQSTIKTIVKLIKKIYIFQSFQRNSLKQKSACDMLRRLVAFNAARQEVHIHVFVASRGGKKVISQ